MSQQDTTETKKKIVSILENRGPSLPSHISQETGFDMLFASVFLSELLSEKKIRITHMKVGSSPIYFVSGHESRLEDFSQYLKSREKDAFELLKNEKFLSDNLQEPSIRVALRSIKDFAIPFSRDGETYWRYFMVSESDFPSEKREEEIPVKEEKEAEVVNEEVMEQKKKEPEKVKKPKTKKRSKAKSREQDNKFFDRIKELLSEKHEEITDILNVSKECLVLKIRENKEEFILVAYNKRRIDEKDILNAYKKVSGERMKYRIMSLGEPSKKLAAFIDAVKDLESVEKV